MAKITDQDKLARMRAVMARAREVRMAKLGGLKKPKTLDTDLEVKVEGGGEQDPALRDRLMNDLKLSIESKDYESATKISRVLSSLYSKKEQDVGTKLSLRVHPFCQKCGGRIDPPRIYKKEKSEDDAELPGSIGENVVNDAGDHDTGRSEDVPGGLSPSPTN